MTQYLIAGVHCHLRDDSGNFAFGDNLIPFRAPSTGPPHLELILNAIPPPPPATGPASQEVTTTTDDTEFRRHDGRLLATDRFARCQVFTHPAEPFTGQPWLMLALWGYLTHRDGLFLHGACCDLDGRLVLLLGDQQVGKSTLARLIVQAGGSALTDEYPFVTHRNAIWQAHGSPWPALTGPCPRLTGPLSALFFLRHAPANTLDQLTPPEAARRLMRNNRFFTWSPEAVTRSLELIDQLCSPLPLYDYGFVPDLTAVEALRQCL